LIQIIEARRWRPARLLCGVLSYLVAMPLQAFSLLISRSTVFLSLQRSASCPTGRPPPAPFLFRLAAWSDFSGMTALM
jgi:hypothetical protein